ncbi:hypothetical protein [Curtobacterium sp. VKM Ac-1395]|uniref:hypothetical protein n=1 Tax=Curtobacterium sp. VKM Ac-1395 TaxID=2783815 RepID=UPI00188D79CB|nr:hypothetical protein [Curtobacterium sp. VKM Ac-1395]MBF4590434.1 hypothetical protein [Curtobacterium sp. VKM Ac-1395]
MPRRTLGLETIKSRPGRNHKQSYGVLDDIDGHDLLELFYGLFVQLDKDVLRDEQRGRYTRIEEVKANGRSVVVVANSGWYGETGQTINVRTHATEHDRKVDDSATIRTRLALTVPPGGKVGLFGVERQGNEGSGPGLIELFKRSLVSSFPTYAFDTETVLETSAWSEAAELIEVTAVSYNFTPDIADGPSAQPKPLGRLQHSIVPEKGERILPRWFWDKLRKRQLDAADFLGFGEGTSVDETIVRVEGRDGRVKSFALETERVPAIRAVLTNNGESALTETAFLRRAQDEARDYFDGMGLTWQDQWKSGQWTAEALATRLAPHRPGSA